MEWDCSDIHHTGSQYSPFFDYEKRNIEDGDDPSELTPLGDLQLTPASNANVNFLARLKHNFTTYSLGSFLNQDYSHSNCGAGIYPHQRAQEQNKPAKLPTPPDSPTQTPRLLAKVKRRPHLSSSISHSQSHTRSKTEADSYSMSSSNRNFTSGSNLVELYSTSPDATLVQPVSGEKPLKSPKIAISASHTQSTPPLTPDLLADVHSLPCAYSHDLRPHVNESSIHIKSDDEENAAKSTCGMHIKKGKNIAPPFPYETLIADISSDASLALEEAVDDEELKEWYGLEYTIELSRRDSRASDSSSSTTGEHSKSRESWAAIHQGSVHPFFENRDYREWQRWHRHLDRAERRMRQKRTHNFTQDAERNANLFVDEMYARRAIENYGHLLDDRQFHDATHWVDFAAEHCPDPYYPSEKHNLSWILKHHRSVASLRELRNSDNKTASARL